MTIQELKEIIRILGNGLGKDPGEIRASVRRAIEACGASILLVKGDLSGIQSYLYRVNAAEDVDGGVAKRLRGRSFYLSAICHSLADELCRVVGVRANLHILHATAGNFLIVLPSSPEIESKVKAWNEEVQKWLWMETWNELYLSLALRTCTRSDLSSNFSGAVAIPLQEQLNRGKLQKFLPVLHPGVSESSRFWKFDFPAFRSELVEECHSCSVLPVDIRTPGDETNLCYQCKGFELLGGAKATGGDYLLFGRGTKRNAINFHSNSAVAVRGPSTLPRIIRWSPQWEDFHGLDRGSCHGSEVDCKRELLCKHCSLQKTKPEDCDPDRLVTRFNCLSTIAHIRGGAARLGIIAADGDSFSYHFNSTPGITLEDQVVLGRLIYSFFGQHLIDILKQHDCLLIYSGGDDFVALGPWAGAIEAVNELRTDFNSWTAGRLHFSAGLLISNPNEPIFTSIGTARGMMRAAKNQPGKNSLQAMGTCIPWTEYDRIKGLAETLATAVRDEVISNAFIYGLYQIYREYERYVSDGDVRGLRYLGWLASFINRNLKLEWEDSERRSLADSLRKQFDEHLLSPNDRVLLPYLRFALDWAALSTRDNREKEELR